MSLKTKITKILKEYLVENSLNEASKKDVLTKKVGLDKESSEILDRLCGSLSVWIANKIIDQYFEHFSGYTRELSKEELKELSLEETNKSLKKSKLQSQITSIMDFIRVGLNGNTTSVKSYSFRELVEKSNDWHDSLGVSSGDINYNEQHPIIEDFRDENGNGFYWVDLETKNSPEECDRMGHCGRSSYGNLYSLRETKPINNKYKLNKSHLTAAIGSDGIMYQLKGPKNSKPKEEFHQYILPLFYVLGGEGEEDDYLIQGFGTEYASEQDFKLSDLPDSVIKDLYQNRPDLFSSRSIKRKLMDMGLIERVNIDYNITLKINPEDVNDYVDGDWVVKKVKRKSSSGYESTMEVGLFETILSGDIFDLTSGGSYWDDWESGVEYYLNESNEKLIDDFLKEKAKENPDFDEEEYESMNLKDKIEEFDEDGDIKNAISSSMEICQSNSEYDYYYKTLKECLKEYGKVVEMSDEGVVLKVNVEPFIKGLNDDEIEDYFDRCNDDIECVFIEMVNNYGVEKPKFSIDSRWSPDINSRDFNETLIDNLNL